MLPGTKVYWYDSPRQGYGTYRPVKAIVLRHTAKRVVIQVWLRDMESRTFVPVERYVKEETLIEHEWEDVCLNI